MSHASHVVRYKRRHIGPLGLMCALALHLGSLNLAHAQSSHPINLVVPAPAGSAPDIVARLLGDELRHRLGQAVVVDNRPGAGGIIAVMAAKSANNADTLLLAQAAVVAVTPLTYRAARYDLERDMEPVAIVADTPMMLVAQPAQGNGSLAEVMARARRQTDALAMGSTGRGSIPHLTAVLLAQAANVRLNIVPMSNSGQAIQAAIQGDTALSVDGVATLLPMVRAGRLKALAVTSDRVLPGLEGIALAKDSVPGLLATGWFALYARKGVSSARLEQLNQAVNAALRSPEMIQKLAATANYPVGGSVTQTRSFLINEKTRWASAVHQAGLQPE